MSDASCQVCARPSTSRCSKYRFTRYCSREHSTSVAHSTEFDKAKRADERFVLLYLQDWTRHKRECPILASGLDKQVGFPLTVKAVVFTTEGGPPRITDLRYKLELFEDVDYLMHQLDLTPVLGRATPRRTRIDIAGFNFGRPLEHRLLLIHNDNFIAEGCPVNKCIQAIHGGRGYRWCGNLVAVRIVNKEKRMGQYQDVTPEDVEAVKKYFEQGGNGDAACKFSWLYFIAPS